MTNLSSQQTYYSAISIVENEGEKNEYDDDNISYYITK
jgi:hypothetical protein